MAKDFDNFLRDNIVGMAEMHVEVWAERYENQTLDQSEYDLEVNHDISLELDYAEERLERELTNHEEQELITKFNEEVIQIIEDTGIHI